MNIIPFMCNDGFVPDKAYDGSSAAFDLYAESCDMEYLHTYHAYECSLDKLCEISPGGRALIKTSVRMAIPPNLVGLVCPRSGLAIKYGVTVLNSPGIIDSGYLNAIGVILCNLGTNIFTVRKGDKIAQLLLLNNSLVNLMRTDELNFDTKRGMNGWGSSDKPKEENNE